jgi:hypothetical protein
MWLCRLSNELLGNLANKFRGYTPIAFTSINDITNKSVNASHFVLKWINEDAIWVHSVIDRCFWVIRVSLNMR